MRWVLALVLAATVGGAWLASATMQTGATVTFRIYLPPQDPAWSGTAETCLYWVAPGDPMPEVPETHYFCAAQEADTVRVLTLPPISPYMASGYRPLANFFLVVGSGAPVPPELVLEQETAEDV